ncbi:pentatricopeptide repeat-containing protein At3g20730-like isoform X2 [Selaginella moellendorffii]|uniref:pentatricopeptide repeat-containing protein At3g20730-like isoform X2 n=1 Tax=Selaginella moellendorffii TaxID=88036 RepID=UPI000D1CA172|nr:pentatricopeptide repeat-containing protein At3g20730-like isoform X2 [Selaginella moellendorffii]|eukprot:XP_024524968.1 pentatricopeptide repeat-containing protein At3g20730-like isoform X2 [Selaginella moellendorffii]
MIRRSSGKKCIQFVRSSAIGTEEGKKKAILKECLGYQSTIQNLGQVRDALGSINAQARPDPELYFHLLQVCSCERSLALGIQVHENLAMAGIDDNVFVHNNLIKMYGKCGSPARAYAVFQAMRSTTVVSWTSMITAFSQNGELWKAFEIYQRMLLAGIAPNRVTFFTAIDVCARGPLAREAYLLSRNVGETEHCKDSTVGTALVNMFGKCGDVDAARETFDVVRQKTVISWTALITAYANHGFYDQALENFQKMELKLVAPNEVTFVAVLNACADSGDLEQGRIIHEKAAAGGLISNVLVGTALVNLYSKCGCLAEARKAFRMILDKDVVSYNAIIAASAELGSYGDTLKLFYKMLLEGKRPTKATFVSLLNACSGPAALRTGRMIHEYVRCDPDLVVRTALINMYGKCGALEDSERVFYNMSSRNLVSWNTMFGVYADAKCSSQAFRLYQRIQLEGVKPDGITFMSLLNSFASEEALEAGKVVHAHAAEAGLEDDVCVANSLLDMYGKCGSLGDTRLLFEKMELRNFISWTSMITACFKQGKDREALHVYHRMLLEAVVPDRLTFATVLNACASLPSLKDGKAVHGCVRERGLAIELSLGTALVSMYGKGGSLMEAQAAFELMAERDTAAWNSMLAAYAQHGKARGTILAFRRMQQEDVKPDAITYVIVLSACRHAGLLEEALECFTSMTREHGLLPTSEHYGSLIDLVGRTGRLEEAEKFAGHLKQPSNPMVLTSLLDACRVHGDVERATRAARTCIGLVPEEPPTYVTLSSIYSVGVYESSDCSLRPPERHTQRQTLDS